MTATMIGEGDAFYGGERMPAVYALGRAGLEPVVLGAEGRPGAAQRHAILHRACAGTPCSRSSACFNPR